MKTLSNVTWNSQDVNAKCIKWNKEFINLKLNQNTQLGVSNAPYLCSYNLIHTFIKSKSVLEDNLWCHGISEQHEFKPGDPCGWKHSHPEGQCEPGLPFYPTKTCNTSPLLASALWRRWWQTPTQFHSFKLGQIQQCVQWTYCCIDVDPLNRLWTLVRVMSVYMELS